MESEYGGSLKARSRQAYENRQAEEEFYERKRRKEEDARAAVALSRLLKERLDVDIQADGPTVEVEGLTFGLGGYSTLVVLSQCPECGEARWSERITDLAALGRYLANPCYEYHYCQDVPEDEDPNQAAPPTPADLESGALRFVQYFHALVQHANWFAGMRGWGAPDLSELAKLYQEPELPDRGSHGRQI